VLKPHALGVTNPDENQERPIIEVDIASVNAGVIDVKWLVSRRYLDLEFEGLLNVDILTVARN
jgi:hypothetical protein